jgi:MoxR-like ATPase
MALTNDEVFDLARDAVKKMFDENGPDYTFPFDAIWQNTLRGVDIPSVSRPHQSARLVSKGFVEKTGAMTRAISDKRAGSATPEYRFGPALVTRTAPSAAPAATGSARPSDLLKRLQLAMDAEGYILSAGELANFYLAMIVSPLVILSGISGTGKSLLPRKFAKHTKSLFHAIPVQPQWSDNSDLFGYVPTLAPEKFIEGHLIESLRKAKGNSKKLVIALLDEMNLAPVEHYFSDFLSVAESRSRQGTAIVTDKLPIDLPKAPADKEDGYKDLRDIGLPQNLRVIGTANMDETTHSFSPKVLDRAFTIEFDDPDLMAFATALPGATENFEALAASIVNESNAISVQDARALSEKLFDQIAQMLDEIQQILSPAGIKFGYRTRDAILLYLHFWRQLGLGDILTSSAALDFCLLQKVLPKVSGSGEALSEALKKLGEWLEKNRSETDDGQGQSQEFAGPFERSLQKVKRMAALLDTDGATHYWGT